MVANSANPALGLNQKPGSMAAADAELEVLCAILCCDQKDYNLPNTRGGRKTCQRLAHRKHSCVTHALREKSNGKLTQKNKFSNVYAAPRYPGVVSGKTLIPDTIAGNVVIDAKFPCDTSKVHGPKNKPPGTGPGFTTAKGKRAYPSITKSGTSYMGDKELNQYTKIPGVKKSVAKTPSDAKAATNNGADCAGKTC